VGSTCDSRTGHRVDDARRALDLLAIGVPAVEHEHVVIVPHLRVAHERLVVEIDRDRLGRDSATETLSVYAPSPWTSASRATRCQRCVRTM